MIRNADADGLARRVRHTPRHFLGGFQDEGPGAGRRGLQQPVLLVVHAGEVADFSQVAAQQCQMVSFVQAA
ncbi:hypothetical protein G6F68_021393 [Rhizopus microsporus]|nr:hypothetical protein G6F68_021393 [Rhizopus microsporus]